jgi:hypothetical protein
VQRTGGQPQTHTDDPGADCAREVEALREAGASFRNDIAICGPTTVTSAQA